MDYATNYQKAKLRADEIDKEIIEVLKSGQSFRVEAGAGFGKTYSLMKVIDWIQHNKASEYLKKGQQVICVTYTNVAVNEIKRRLSENSAIIPSTIHAFAWDCMSLFQTSLIEKVKELNLLTSDIDVESVQKISYTLGARYLENGCFYLYHDDVIKLFVSFLDNAKFRWVLAKKYPIILIDEYQDSFTTIMDKLVQYFINPKKGPQIGLFGDSWQTIYSSLGGCGYVESPNLVEIKKESNFRSEQIIVDVLNKIRPKLPQITASDENEGRIFVITTNDYKGYRIPTGYYKGELADSDLTPYINNVTKKLKDLGWGENTKILMLTHKLLSKQQNYSNLLECLDKHFKDFDDVYVVFFETIVEPIYIALKTNNVSLLYETLGVQRNPIDTKLHKQKWLVFLKDIEEARTKSIYDVIKCCIDFKYLPISPVIQEQFNRFTSGIDEKYHKKNLGFFYNISYSEAINAIAFHKADGLFSTDHGVKGEEYDNVELIVTKGWNNYKFEENLYLNEDGLEGNALDEYIRNRNLFYVCCSRAKKRLALFLTVKINTEFRQYLERVFGKENIYSYSDFLNLH